MSSAPVQLRYILLIQPELGAANKIQAIALKKGGIARTKDSKLRNSFLKGRSVRLISQAVVVPKTKLTMLEPLAKIKLLIMQIRKRGSVNTVR